jgi:HlyD family secretion protein
LSQRSLIAAEALEQAQQTELLARNIFEMASLRVASLAPGKIEEVLLNERLAALQALFRAPLAWARV